MTGGAAAKDGAPAKGATRVQATANALRARIASAAAPGTRLPSEAQLCAEFAVSRTVIREAVAVLRAEGLVEARQGAGVFVLAAPPDTGLPFADVDPESVASVVEMLELRAAVEVECAALAARRHSPAQVERILEAADAVRALAAAGQSTADADMAFHLSIAEATNNPRFSAFLGVLGTHAIPRHALRPAGSEAGQYLDLIAAEHSAIAEAILEGDSARAGAAMRRHLAGAQKRYRGLLRARTGDG